MRKRSNSFSVAPPPATGIAAIGARLKVINPYAGTNPRGRCLQTAVETAEVLTTFGRNPAKVNDASPDDPDAKAPHALDRSFDEGLARHKDIFVWLRSGGVPAGAVFVVDMDSDDAGYHCWNFVRGPGPIPTIYLIDASTHIFKEVVEPADFSEWMTENFTDPMDLFNYANPDGMDEALDVYYWGQLVQPWLGMLQRPTPTKAAEAPL